MQYCQSDNTFAAFQHIMNDLTDDIYLLIKPNGSIIESNRIAQESILSERQTNFYDLFLKEDKPAVFSFIEKLTPKNASKMTFNHYLNEEKITIKYLGKMIEDEIVLLGKVLGESKADEADDHGYKEKYEKEYEFRKFMFRELEIGILTITSENKIDCCNERMKLFVDLECVNQLIGQNLLQLDYDHPLLSQMRQMTREIRNTKIVNERFYYEDDCLFQVKGMYFDSDESIRFVLYDRSHQQRFENLLMYKKQMESVSHLAAGVAHELRNPLSVIQGFIQLSAVTKDFSKYYDTVLSELARMNEIIEDFLSVSRRKMQKQKQRPDLIIKSLIHIIQSECLLHNLLFEWDVEEVDVYTMVNESMIKQVVLNLLRNSIEAYNVKQTNRRIHLQGKATSHHYEITFKDQGPGMEKSVLEQLGKPFFTTKEKGNGIGIPLCKKIIEEHGGTFNIISKLGEGTTIRFRLPFLSEKNS
ncbi:ATP-binding protein [Pseudalkalibacillus salsuginis]|uniref:ATP-binding protein n=1 Tax=Pseudalkalibacillus salsuginis TaxID=2910972 RepID=UPI001F15F281|nr:ATP-binding protein [Pseudalkalibacillus salsuginis]MCF6408505.1 ATP-binding protein [Pseudalkalibacillus salsuginis]